MGSKLGIDALVFDFDGLILDTEWPQFVSVGEAFAAHGVDLSLDEWRDGVGRTDQRHWSEWLEEVLGTPIDGVSVRASRLERHHALIAEEVVRPGVVELLDAAAADRIGLAVASSSPLDWVAPHLERLGLIGRFDTVITGDDVVSTKPAPDLYLAATASLGAAPARSVAFEDSAHGCTSAVAAGLRCVAVPNRITRGQDFARADLVLESLADIDTVDLALMVSDARPDPAAGTRR
jgi:HAD superfamily hydrolase (TIGR01509 family)